MVECIIVYSFYNVVNEEKITLPYKKEIKVLPGFYSLKDILNLIPIDIEVNKNTGNLSNSQVIFSDGLEKLINSKSDKKIEKVGWTLEPPKNHKIPLKMSKEVSETPHDWKPS